MYFTLGSGYIWQVLKKFQEGNVRLSNVKTLSVVITFLGSFDRQVHLTPRSTVRS